MLAVLSAATLLSTFLVALLIATVLEVASDALEWFGFSQKRVGEPPTMDDVAYHVPTRPEKRSAPVQAGLPELEKNCEKLESLTARLRK